MSGRSVAEVTKRLNVAIIAICSIFFVVCIYRQLWIPALLNGVLVVSNGIQFTNRRRP